MPIFDPISAPLYRHRLTKGWSRVSQAWMARPQTQGARIKVMAFHHPSRISYSQLYPFFHYAPEFWDQMRLSLRALPFEQLKDPDAQLPDPPDVVLLQPWFTETPETLQLACQRVAKWAPNARISFLDSYAHNDLRFAKALPENLQFYAKKSLFKNRAHYHIARRGDTNVTEYYGDLGGLNLTATDFDVPQGFTDKLLIFPGFLTAPHLINTFDAPTPPPQTGRSIDIQVRLATKGTDWYEVLRGRAVDAVNALSGIKLSGTGSLDAADYMTEMTQSRLCFSPFGYGELCWRDIEATQTGSVLIKPDMRHLETAPDLFVPWETYAPIRWDYADLGDVVDKLLGDEALRTRIAQNAYEVARHYIHSAQFIPDTAPLFQPGPA